MIQGLCQEARPRSEWPYPQDWIVLRYAKDRRYANHLYIVGINLNSEPGEYGYEFCWAIPMNKISWRYDFSWARESHIDSIFIPVGIDKEPVHNNMRNLNLGIRECPQAHLAGNQCAVCGEGMLA